MMHLARVSPTGSLGSKMSVADAAFESRWRTSAGWRQMHEQPAFVPSKLLSSPTWKQGATQRLLPVTTGERVLP